MRYFIIVLWMLFAPVSPAAAQVSISMGFPGVSIGINLPLYPELVRVPGYPVYYAPRLDSNYFFYDGLYWVYQRDDWYASTWYNGPWEIVHPDVVPLFVLRIPVSYYRNPPDYFRGWRGDAPPRWGQHWGRGWEQQRSGWARWDRRSAPAAAPLPSYQRQYAGDRYPQPERQRDVRQQNYRYQPRDALVRQHEKRQVEQAPAQPERREAARPERRDAAGPGAARPDERATPARPAPAQQGLPPASPDQRARDPQRSPQAHETSRPNDAASRNQPEPREQRRQHAVQPETKPAARPDGNPNGRGAAPEGRPPQQDKGREREPDRGDAHGRNAGGGR